MMFRTVVSASVVLLLTVAAMGQNKKLVVGDPAPGLDIEKWVKKSETTLQSGKVYVVEFWATWCGPCRESIPHLSKLQDEYADAGLTVIGVSTDEDTKKVEPFVRKQGERMDYTVAIDRQGSTKRAWLDAAGQNGIPCAFIIDRKGKIAFIGNPHPGAHSGFEDALKKVMKGRFDPKLERQAAPMLTDARAARKVRNWRMASKLYDDVVKLDASVFAEIGLEKFEMLLVDMDDRAKAYEYARGTLMGELFANDAGALAMLAENIVNNPKIDQPKRDMDLALDAAEASRRVAGNSDSEALAVVAMVRFSRGEVEQAIDLQKQAYFNASPKRKPEYRRTLNVYENAASRVSGMGKPS
jgi:thiol-disulfide isomerase/thioredoxin